MLRMKKGPHFFGGRVGELEIGAVADGYGGLVGGLSGWEFGGEGAHWAYRGFGGGEFELDVVVGCPEEDVGVLGMGRSCEGVGFDREVGQREFCDWDQFVVAFFVEEEVVFLSIGEDSALGGCEVLVGLDVLEDAALVVAGDVVCVFGADVLE